MGKRKLDICGYCCEWVSDHRGADPAEVMRDYPEMMRKVLRRRFGLSKKTAKDFVRYACEGNWLKLHMTDVERGADSELYARMILSEVHYCSDRWSWDRVLRIQWLYRRLFWKCQQEEQMREYLPTPDQTEAWGCFCEQMGQCGTYLTVHVMECPECGRTYEHVNGDYERCPHCGTRFGTGEDEQEPDESVTVKVLFHDPDLYQTYRDMFSKMEKDGASVSIS